MSLAGRYGNPAFEARVGLAFDNDSELSLLEDWARAAFVAALPVNDPQSRARLDSMLADDLHAPDLLARGELIIRRDPQRDDPWIVCWQTQDPVAHLDLRRGGLALGPLAEDTGWSPSRSSPHEVLRTPAGEPVPPLTDPSSPVVWEQYAAALPRFRMADLVTATSAVELVARRSNADPELPSLRRLAPRFPALSSRQNYVTFAMILDDLPSSLLITDNRRVPVRTIVEPLALTHRPSIGDGSACSRTSPAGGSTFASR